MLNKGWKNLILVLMLSLCACALISFNNTNLKTYATSQPTADCYYLLGDDGNPYQANVSVGTVEGLGDFVVGEQNIELKATANANYKIVGWQVTYHEQDDKIEFYNTENLLNNSKIIKLIAKDGSEIDVVISYEEENGYFIYGSFNISTVFEDLTVTPIFDHIYYQVKIDSLIEVATHTNAINIGENLLYYSTKVDGEIATTYADAYIKMGENYFYYGTVYEENEKFYTLHYTLADEPIEQKIDIELGAYRVDDIVDLTFNVGIIENDILSSNNVDVYGVTVTSQLSSALVKYDSASPTEQYYNVIKDDYLRTTNFSIKIKVSQTNSYLNTLTLNYHKLFLVDIELLINGSASHDEYEDILGDLTVSANEIKSNLSIYDFYSIVELDALKFLVKTATDNNSRAFRINSLATITKTTENGIYKYYTFNNIDGSTNTGAFYSNINQNIIVNINYLSVTYEIQFEVAEYMVDSNYNPVLVALETDEINSIYLNRGAQFSSGKTNLESSIGNDGDYYLNTSTRIIYQKEAGSWVEVSNSYMDIVGYDFVGFATSLTGTIEQEISYLVDETEPVGTTIILCFKKASYSVAVTNFNKIVSNSTYPLSSITFKRINSSGTLTETLTASGDNPTLSGDVAKLSTLKVKLGETLSISYEVNNGFNVKYSLFSPEEILSLIQSGATEEELEAIYLTSFEITQDLLNTYLEDDLILIYVYEEQIAFSLTYFIKVNQDADLKYVMADIDVEVTSKNSDYVITKEDIYGIEINAQNDNLDEYVSKITVSGLYLNDLVTLSSIALPYGNDTYVFNWFIEERATLSYYFDSEDKGYKHSAKIIKDSTIQVVYSIPVAQVMISLDEDFSSSTEFVQSLKVKVDDKLISLTTDGENIVSVAVEQTVTITIVEMSFGYEFAGYQLNDNSPVQVDNLSFEHVTLMGANEIVLKFKRTIFQFYFLQNGAFVDGEEISGQYVDFDGKTFAELTVDQTSLDITKPIGYYVKNVRINNVTYNVQVENNLEYRNYSDQSIYKFSLDRKSFIDVVQNYSLDLLPEDEPDQIKEIYVELEYSIYLYDIIIGYRDIMSDGYNENIDNLKVQLNYTLNGNSTTIPYEYDNHTIRFEECVPYGANTNIMMLEKFQTGIRYAGWAYPDTNLVEYQNSEEALILGEVKKNLEFLYLYTFVDYKIRLEYDSLKGAPQVEINGTLVNLSNVTLHLFDSVKILTNAIRSNGFKFDTLTYYNNQEEQQVYNQSNAFYVEKFIANDFQILNYTITFKINYDLLQLTIQNTIKEKSGALANAPDLSFTLDNLAQISIVAFDQNNTSRDIVDNSKVNFYDVVKIVVKINKNAINTLDGNAYNMALGLELIKVQVAGTLADITQQEDGSYLIQFLIQEFLPEDGEVIKITYTLETQLKNVTVTTVVTNSKTFYQNIEMFVSSSTYYGGTKSSAGKQFLDKYSNWQFLAPITSYVAMNSTYKKFFRISGVQIYLTKYITNDSGTGSYSIVGAEIDPKLYIYYGITLENVTRTGSKITDCTVHISNLQYNFQIRYKIQPIITYNGGPNFEKEFDWDSEGNPIEQQLTAGSSDSDNIQISSEIVSCLTIKYQKIIDGVLVDGQTDFVTNAGEYKVFLTFANTTDFDWLNEIEVAENVRFNILPKQITLTYDSNSVEKNRVEKTYNKSSYYNVELIYQFLKYTDGKVTLSYADLDYNLKLDSNINCYISSAGKDGETTQANPNLYYNLYVYNLALQETDFNKNFILANSDLIIEKYIKINKLVIDLTGVQVSNKVYDGTDYAELISPNNISLSKKIAGDDLLLTPSLLKIKFLNSAVGTNKTVVIDASNALGGYDAGNYSINQVEVKGLTIYPYSISTSVEGVGTVSLVNIRGLKQKDCIDLIPLNAVLHIQPILAESVDYAHIYSKISKYVKGNQEFSIGYTVSLTVNGVTKPISNKLYLSVPKVKNITGSYFLTGNQTGETDYNVSNGKVFVDLSAVKNEVDTIFLTQKRIYLQPWQIALIVILAVAVITAVIITFILIRVRKSREYSVHDKI